VEGPDIHEHELQENFLLIWSRTKCLLEYLAQLFNWLFHLLQSDISIIGTVVLFLNSLDGLGDGFQLVQHIQPLFHFDFAGKLLLFTYFFKHLVETSVWVVFDDIFNA